jgi:predicted esterase
MMQENCKVRGLARFSAQGRPMRWEPLAENTGLSPSASTLQFSWAMMFPSLRGGNDNPGVKEGFWSEVDDVLAATDYLAQQDFVDPQRIYLGGHSSGGTPVLLAAECSDRYRAVFSFGPAASAAGY